MKSRADFSTLTHLKCPHTITFFHPMHYLSLMNSIYLINDDHDLVKAMQVIGTTIPPFFEDNTATYWCNPNFIITKSIYCLS